MDYVLNGATVNNATLNFDQGTVLALTAPFYQNIDSYSWGLRLNPGGRLNVNGVPTNRVVFTRLESIQEFPLSGFAQSGLPLSLITFKGMVLPSGTMVTPLPEARFRYADFLAPAGSTPHFGAAYAGDTTYDMMGQLELNGCLLQNGEFNYEAGGPAGRVLGVTNTVFERATIALKDSLSTRTAVEQLTAANNLFYNCDMWLKPAAVDGANWMFRDNIFDQVTFHGTAAGPVADNRNNAYVGMSTMTLPRLSPNTQAGTDKVLTSLTYESGALGKYYLPTTATQLVGTGSRTAGAASLYHFTSFANNTKEAGNQVNLGPAYLALVNGNPADTDSDGIADFIEDRSGGGGEDADEMPWQTANTGSLAILAPTTSQIVSGILRVHARLDVAGAAVEFMTVRVDGVAPLGSSGIAGPNTSIAEFEIDTTFLDNGPHELSLCAFRRNPLDPSSIYETVSDPINITASNDIRYPAWQDLVGTSIRIAVETPSSLPSYTLWFFGPEYPRSYSPSPRSYREGEASNGLLAFSGTVADLTGDDPGSGPSIYSFTELATAGGSGAGAARANP